MTNRLPAVILALLALSSSAQQTMGVQAAASAADQAKCDCMHYPFKPPPHCYGYCVGKLASTPNPDLSAVQGLDPGVALSIKVLAADPKKSTIDFGAIKDKPQVERAAGRAVLDKQIKIESLGSR